MKRSSMTKALLITLGATASTVFGAGCFAGGFAAAMWADRQITGGLSRKGLSK